jgi:hypothetical protein
MNKESESYKTLQKLQRINDLFSLHHLKKTLPLNHPLYPHTISINTKIYQLTTFINLLSQYNSKTCP